MKTVAFIRNVLLIAFGFLCQCPLFSQKLVVEEGVSENLAASRKQALSDIRYALHFHVPETSSQIIRAEETLSFEWKKNSQPLLIDFKAADSAVRAVVVNDRRIKVQYHDEHIVIDQKWLVDGANSIAIFFRAGHSSLNRNNDFLYTLLVPDRARTVFPCFDQPNLKAKFQLTLTLPLQWTALANAPMQDSTVTDEAKTYRYRESDLFSTYLFSFVAGRFRETSQLVGDHAMRFLFRETDSNKIRLSIDSVFGWHRKALQFLEAYTGIPFPFQKLDAAAIPDFQYGGMEHVGAIDYKASSLFLDSGATKDQENARSSLIAHETAHMWFGDLVTMQWFNDVWMKEVFANFMADKITQGAQNSRDYELKFLLSHFPRAYAIDRTAGANGIRQPLSNLQEAGALYGPIIYDKAPVMMRQLERLMGAEAFREGLREYLKKYSFGNATWPDLIAILDRLTPADLQAWNKVWVNTPGRPQFSYNVVQHDGRIFRFVINQKGEQIKDYFLPQFFEVALVYKDHVEEITINMNKPQVLVKEAEGKPLPEYVLFNSSGQGYGVFPVDTAMHGIDSLENPLQRASAYINLYENMLNGKAKKPEELLLLYVTLLAREKEELSASLLGGYISDIYWRFIPAPRREKLSSGFAKGLWQMMSDQTSANKKKIIFRAFQSVVTANDDLDTLYRIWKEQTPPAGVKLSEDDYTSLALNLTLKGHTDTAILTAQQSRISNPDRQQRLSFLAPALSANVAVRDSFFASLKNLAVRRKEAWVQEALAYLHHPLRAASSIRYLDETLALLQEVQQTGDIFFPSAWLNASFGSYQLKEAADIVRRFLATHPAYPLKLKAKILQATDPLFRAERLVQKK